MFDLVGSARFVRRSHKVNRFSAPMLDNAMRRQIGDDGMKKIPNHVFFIVVASAFLVSFTIWSIAIRIFPQLPFDSSDAVGQSIAISTVYLFALWSYNKKLKSEYKP